MIVADTSVWVSFFRHENLILVRTLSALLDEQRVLMTSPTKIEILSGTSRKDYHRLKTLLSALPTVEPGAEEWGLIEDWVEMASLRGDRFSVADLLIAAITRHHAESLWSLDQDFVRMAKLGFVKLMK